MKSRHADPPFKNEVLHCLVKYCNIIGTIQEPISWTCLCKVALDGLTPASVQSL